MKTSVELFIESKVLLEYQPIVEMFRELIKKEYPDIKEEMRGGTEYKNEILNYYISQAIEFDGLKKEDVNIDSVK